MTAPPFDLDAARARFTALQRDLVFFDGPGGTQVPDSVIDAIGRYLRESNANVSGPYETSRRTETLFAEARRSPRPGRSPMFVLDRRRIATYTDDATEFDNRYVAKLPATSAAMRALDVSHVGLVLEREIHDRRASDIAN